METIKTTRKRAKERSLRALVLVVVLATLAFVLFAGTALAAPPWSDAPNSWWVSSYGVTADQAGTVAGGYPDGTFKPTLLVTRAQFAKMAVDGLGLATANPATATFKDVAKGSTFFIWVEGAYHQGIIGGYPSGTGLEFRPGNNISRQQGYSILGRYLSQRELSLRGHIAGDDGNYASLDAWYLAEGIEVLAGFADANSVAPAHAPATAYLAYNHVVQGSLRSGGLYLDPGSSLARAPTVVLILRARAVTFSTAPPTVTLLNPSSGPTVGGNSVVITGTNFTGATSVKFGLVNATSYVVNSATQITAVAPAGTSGTTVEVTVTTPAGTSSIAGTANDYAYGVPTVTALNPAGGDIAGGTAVTVTGTNFVAGATVAFGTGFPATSVVVVNATTITCVSPAHAAGVVDVTVTTSVGTSAIVGAGSHYTYGVPTVTALNPTGGAVTGGTAVTITGTNFVTGATVAFGTGFPATSVVVVNATTITCVSPAHVAGVVDVTVTTPAGTSSIAGAGNDYAFGVPSVTALNPVGGDIAGGTAVTITGTNFVTGATVAFSTGFPATSVVVVNATTITCVSPAHAAGVVDVTVTTSAGTSATAGTGNDYLYGVPTVTALNPTGGAVTGGTAVTITGTNFVTGATVAFGTGFPATSVVVVNGTTITCVSPAHVAGVVDVTVTTPAGTSSIAGAGNDYVYGEPTVTALNPTFGGTAGGTAVTITGTNFLAGATVAFGTGFPATSVVVVNSTTITCVSPAHVAGAVDVTVTVAATTSSISGAGNDYTYLAFATAPSAIHLGLGSTASVGGFTDVQIPLPGATDTHGAVTGWVATTAAKIKFTVTNVVGTSSTITINGGAYISGADYAILAATPLTIVVTTTEAGKTNAVRTFTVTVADLYATAPSAIVLAVGSAAPVGGVTNVAIPAPGATDNTGKVTGWVTTSADKIKFTVTPGSAGTSAITINTVAYTSGADYTIAAAGTLTIVVTTTEASKTTAVRTFTVDVTQAVATAPSAIVLAVGSAAPVGGVTNVAIPAPGATDNTGKVTGWVTTSADKIKFTVTPGSAGTSAITINTVAYTSGADYTIAAAGTLTIVVTTTEASKTTAVRTFTVDVTQAVATAPSAIVLAVGSAAPVGGVTNVAIPAPGATDNTGKVTGWVTTSADKIKFTVTPGSAGTSAITINTVAYTSGADYTIAAAGTLTIVVTTTEASKTTAVRTFTVDVTASATAPSAIHLALGSAAPVGGFTDVQIPLPGATDTHGAVTGWVAITAATIKFTVTDAGGAISTITINGAPYSSGADVAIGSATPLTIVVTTTEASKTTAVRTFTVTVTAL